MENSFKRGPSWQESCDPLGVRCEELRSAPQPTAVGRSRAEEVVRFMKYQPVVRDKNDEQSNKGVPSQQRNVPV